MFFLLLFNQGSNANLQIYVVEIYIYDATIFFNHGAIYINKVIKLNYSFALFRRASRKGQNLQDVAVVSQWKSPPFLYLCNADTCAKESRLGLPLWIILELGSYLFILQMYVVVPLNQITMSC